MHSHAALQQRSMSPAAPPGPPLPHCPAATFLDCPAACWQPRPAATDLPHGVWQAHNVCAEVQQALGNHLTLHEAEGGCHEGGLTLPVHPARVQQGWQRRRASTRVTMGRMMRTCRGRERDAAWRRDGALAIQPCDGLANARTCLPACAPAAPAARLVRILLHALARLAIAIPVARVGGGWGGVGGWGGGGTGCQHWAMPLHRLPASSEATQRRSCAGAGRRIPLRALARLFSESSSMGGRWSTSPAAATRAASSA